jgi:hypothetical protein
LWAGGLAPQAAGKLAPWPALLALWVAKKVAVLGVGAAYGWPRVYRRAGRQPPPQLLPALRHRRSRARPDAPPAHRRRVLEKSAALNGPHSERHEAVKRGGKRLLRAPGNASRKLVAEFPSLQRIMAALGLVKAPRALEGGGSKP